MGKFANTLFLLLACLFTVQGMRAKTSTYDFTNGVNEEEWYFYASVSEIKPDGYVSFTKIRV